MMLERPLFVTGLSFLVATAVIIILDASSALLIAVLCVVWISCIIMHKDKLFSLTTIIMLSASIALVNLFAYTHLKLEPLYIAQGSQLAVQGVIIAEDTTDKGGTLYTIDANVPQCRGKVRLQVYTMPRQLEAKVGDSILGIMRVGESYSNESNLIRLSKGDDIFCTIDKVAWVEFKAENLTIFHKLMMFRDKLTDKGNELYSGQIAEIVKGMTLGDKSEMSSLLKEQLNRSGLSHLTAVSGMHISLISMTLLEMFRILKLKPSTGAIILLPILPILAITQALTPSVIRATVMMCVYCISQIFFREYDSLGALGMSALTVLFLNPYSAINIGFLLSFFAVLGIILISKKIKRAIIKSPFIQKHKFCNNILFDCSVEIFSISVAASVFTLPLQIFTFGRFAIASLIAGIPCILLSTPIIFLGLISLLLACTPLKIFGIVISYLVKPCAGLFLIIAKVCSVLPAITFSPDMLYIYPLIIGIYGVGAILIVKKRRNLYKMAILLGILVTIAAHTSYMILDIGTTHLFVHADAVLIMKDHKASIVGNVTSEYDANILKQEMSNNGIYELEQLIIVAEDTDYSYGEVILAKTLNPKKIIAPLSGRYTPHLKKAAPKSIWPLTDVPIKIADNINVTPLRTELGYETQFNINGKKLLKYYAAYGIMGIDLKCDVVLMPNKKPIIINETDKIKTVPLSDGKYLLIR